MTATVLDHPFLPESFDVVNASTHIHRLARRKRLWHHNSPMMWPPPLTDREVKALASTLLPGSITRRHIHGRHSIVWTKPTA